VHLTDQGRGHVFSDLDPFKLQGHQGRKILDGTEQILDASSMRVSAKN
jgi:hypothetical protein